MSRPVADGGDPEVRRGAAEHGVARVLLEAASADEATADVLRVVCEAFGWEYGAFWTVDRDQAVLRCAQTWTPDAAAFARFRDLSGRTSFERGVGLPGRVWQDGLPAWIDDLASDTNFPRGSAAASDGLKAAFAFPLLASNDVCGVMEFFSRESHHRDDQLLPMLARVGTQVGVFIERHRSQRELTRFFNYRPTCSASRASTAI